MATSRKERKRKAAAKQSNVSIPQLPLKEIETITIKNSNYLITFENIFSSNDEDQLPRTKGIFDSIQLFADQAKELLSIYRFSLEQIEHLSSQTGTQQIQDLLAQHVLLAIKSLCLANNYLQYFNATYKNDIFLAMLDLNSELKKILIEMTKANIFVATDFYAKHSELLHQNIACEPYLFTIIFRHTPEPTANLSLHLNWVYAYYKSVERIITTAQSPSLVCTAILCYTSKFTRSLYHGAAFTQLTYDELLDCYKKNLDKLETGNNEDRIFRMLLDFLDVRYTYDNLYLSHTHVAVNPKMTRHLIERFYAGKEISIIESLGTDNTIFILKKALEAYSKINIDKMLLNKILSGQITKQSPEMKFNGGYHNYVDLAYIFLWMLAILQEDILALFITYTNIFEHRHLAIAIKEKTPEDLLIMLRKNDIYSAATSASWSDFSNMMRSVDAMHKDSLYINTAMKICASKFGFKYVPREKYNNNIGLNELAAFDECISIINAERKQMAAALASQELNNDNKTSREDEVVLSRRSFTKRKNTTADASDDNPHSATTNPANFFHRSSTANSNQFEQTYALFRKQKFNDALKEFEKILPKDDLNPANAFTYIKSHWGMADCYRALSKTSSYKNSIGYNELARKHYRLALDYRDKASTLFKENSHELEELEVFRDFLRQELGIENEADKKIALHMKNNTDAPHGLPTSPSVNQLTVSANSQTGIADQKATSTHTLIREKLTTKLITHPAILKLFEELQLHNISSYVHGGAVRDALLNLKNRDVDATADQPLDVIETLLKRNNYRFTRIGKQHPILQIQIDDAIVDLSYKKSCTCDDDLINELLCCDVTINAFRYYPVTRELVYLAQSKQDLTNKTISVFDGVDIKKHSGDDPRRYFRYINVTAKLANLGFRLTENIAQVIKYYKEQLPDFDIKSKQRCFEIFYRSVMHGYSQATWRLMQETNLLLPRLPVYVDIISNMCNKIDAAFNHGNTPSISQCVAAFLFQSFQHGVLKLGQENKYSPEAVEAMMDDVIDDSDIGIPILEIRTQVKNIWSLCLYNNNTHLFFQMSDTEADAAFSNSLSLKQLSANP